MNTDIQQQPLPSSSPQQQPHQQQQHHQQIRFQNSNIAASVDEKGVEEQPKEEDTQSITMGSKRVVGAIIRNGRRPSFVSNYLMFSPSKPSLFHAIVVIFLEFFAWGLLTLPAITVLNTTFPDRTFLMNGLVMGVKGFLSFLSAPLIGALSDVWGRKFFLLITVFFTCLPIPFMKFSPSLYFGLVIISGIFSVTFSVIFAYVADITEEHDRSYAYGWVTATFALSLITSPALGAFISTTLEDDNLVIVLATGVAIFDFIYILFFVPESLPEKLRQKSVSFWESADPFSSLRRAGKDRMILTLCVAVFLSYLPEAGQYSCFFVYLKLVIGFSQVQVASYIALIGVMSVVAQTLFLAWFMKRFGSKNTIMIGLIFEMLQLICFGLGSSHWVVWSAGLLAAIGTITYPAISAYVSTYADADKQGLVQGIITGIRGLCNGLGPCFFGLVFSLFNVDLVKQSDAVIGKMDTQSIRHMFPQTNPNGTKFMDFLNSTTNQFFHSTTEQVIPGPPFLFGSLLVLSAILVMAFIPELVQFPPSTGTYGESYLQSGSFKPAISRMMSPSRSSRTAPSNNYYYKNMQHQTDKDNQCCSIVEPNDMNDDVKYSRNNPGDDDDDDIDYIDDGGGGGDGNIVIDHEDPVINCARSSLSSMMNASSLNTCNLSTTNHSTLTPTSSGSSASSPTASQSSSEGDSDIDLKQRLISSSNNGSGDSRRHSIEYDLDIYQRQRQQQPREHQPNHQNHNQLMPPKPKRHVRHNTIVMANTNHRTTTTTAIHKPPPSSASFTNLGNNGHNHESRSSATNLNQSKYPPPVAPTPPLSFLNSSKHLPTSKTSSSSPFVRGHSKSLNATNLEQATAIMIQNNKNNNNNNNNNIQTSTSATDILVKRLIQSVKT